MREWTTDKHNSIDDRPYGGGPGMILMVEPVVNCVRAVQEMGDGPGQIVMMTPQGQTWNQPMIEGMIKTASEADESNPGKKMAGNRLVILCGRYEGFDQRVMDILNPLEISIGDYILNGGEVGAMVMVDSLVRMIPGVLGDELSSWDDSFSRGNRMLEHPQYTRPREFEGHSVPEILLSGNHPEIERWRKAKSLENTKLRRSDLLD